MKKAIINTDVFTGEKLLKRHAVVIDGRVIHSVTPEYELRAGITTVPRKSF